MKLLKWTGRNVVLTLILIILFVVQAHARKENEHRADNENKLMKTPGISGCIDLKGYSFAGSKVILKQNGEHKQLTKIDVDGCYEFKRTAPNKEFTITITGQPYVIPLSTTVIIYSNLDAREPVPSAFDINDPQSSSNYSVFVTVYDSIGSNHEVTIYFRKASLYTLGNIWQWFAVVDSADSSSGISEIQAQGTLDFTDSGALNAESAVTYPTGGFDFNGGAMQNQIISFDFGPSIIEGATGYEGSSQFGATSTTSYISVD